MEIANRRTNVTRNTTASKATGYFVLFVYILKYFIAKEANQALSTKINKRSNKIIRFNLHQNY